MILVKRFFSSEDTGLYTAASVFGRMVFFLPIGITTVMYPKIVEAHTTNSDTKSIFKRSMLYTGVPTGLLVTVLWLFPKFFLGIFYGGDYIEAESLLKLYGPFMFFFSLTAVMVYYNLAKNRYLLIYLLTCISLVELGLIFIYHSSMVTILQMLLVTNIVLCGISYFIGYHYPESRNRQK